MHSKGRKASRITPRSRKRAGEGKRSPARSSRKRRSAVQTHSLRDRESKVRIEDFAQPPSREGAPASAGMKDFLSRLPHLLSAKDFVELVSRMTRARRRGNLLLWGLGAHVIKAGLSPLIIELSRRGWVQGIALNGAGLIHDFEIARAGHTSEDVERSLEEGRFGFSEETGRELNRAINEGVRAGRGIGESVGRVLLAGDFPHREASIIAAAARLGIPVTAHIAVGTDVIHLHPDCDGSAVGEGSLRDFHRFARQVAEMDGGVYLNIGSAVILPEVFLKALSLVRNVQGSVGRGGASGGRRVTGRGITTATFDFQMQYRARENVSRRPVRAEGRDSRGFYFIGAHEIMIPLLAWSLLAERKGNAGE